MPIARRSPFSAGLLLALFSYALGCGDGAPSESSPAPGGEVSLITETVASGLSVPWEIVFAPDGRIILTEQPGRLWVIENGRLISPPALDFSGRVPGGEAGMLGLDIDRNFSSNGFLYVFYCYKTAASPTGVR